MIENWFVCDGEVGHEIVSVYDGCFRDESVYGREYLPLIESDGKVQPVR